MNLENKLYTSTEVAQILGVSLRSVYRYLEENKLDAEVKTATGRHRFTKQNILDFLYPHSKDTVVPNDVFSQKVESPMVAPVQPIVSRDAFRPKAPVSKPVTPDVSEQPEEEVDWLAKFREAAKKFKEEEAAPVNPVATVPQSQPQPQPVVPTQPIVQEQPVSQVSSPKVEASDDFDDFPYSAPQKASSADVAPKTKRFYYRSMLGGLKDIAQNTDKSARRASVDYAFTLQAGLSLHKPIKPFSLLHTYSRRDDLDLFEKLLQLVPSDPESAQLCIMLSDSNTLYSTRKELHGLYVVSDAQLLNDLRNEGEDDLANDLEKMLSGL